MVGVRAEEKIAVRVYLDNNQYLEFGKRVVVSFCNIAKFSKKATK